MATATDPAGGNGYRGRLAPSPTGFLHLGHASTFLVAARRAEEVGGVLVFRMEDLDPARSLPVFSEAAIEDLRWLGLRWHEGPDVGGSCAPYSQSARRSYYLAAWRKLRDGGFIYPCSKSRKDMELAPLAPHGREPIFPREWRTATGAGTGEMRPDGSNWRFRVPDGREVAFVDGACGAFSAIAGRDFGDFPVWRRDGVPAYELAVVVDDAAMRISEVVRGEDLLLSTCRQLLLHEALDLHPPAYFHAPLLLDETGIRLAKRDGALSLRALRANGESPREIRERIRLSRMSRRDVP